MKRILVLSVTLKWVLRERDSGTANCLRHKFHKNFVMRLTSNARSNGCIMV